jgi:hypothetical protein
MPQKPGKLVQDQGMNATGCRVPRPCRFCKGGDFLTTIHRFPSFSNLNPHPLKSAKDGALNTTLSRVSVEVRRNVLGTR